MIDLHVYNKIDPKKGRLLITEPFEESSYFNRSVILLCEHNADGSFGFVLNNYTTIKLTDFEGLPEFETKIGIGGPVNSKNLYYIHTFGDKLKNSVQITKDLYAGGDFETLKYLISEGLIKENEIRFFLGYSGWVDKQLESELNQNAWLVAEIPDRFCSGLLGYLYDILIHKTIFIPTGPDFHSDRNRNRCHHIGNDIANDFRVFK